MIGGNVMTTEELQELIGTLRKVGIDRQEVEVKTAAVSPVTTALRSQPQAPKAGLSGTASLKMQK